MRVTVVGFSIEGEDMARYYVQHGAQVTVSTVRVPDAQQAARIELEARGARFYVGTNDPEHVADADLVCVSQGVPLTVPAVVAAREAGVSVRSMTGLFLEHYPGPVIGVTGSSGKTTTTSLVDAAFTEAGKDHVLGGNIGVGLMKLLDEAEGRVRSGSVTDESADIPAVLEISHTQLQLVDRSPHVACLTNVTPNHLDQFSWEDYVALKRRIFDFQSPDDAAVLNADDPVSRELSSAVRGRVFLFSLGGDHGANGAFLSEDAVFWRNGGRTELATRVADVTLRGRHNLANVAAATAVAAACEIDPRAVGVAVRHFKPPAHRLELVEEVRGVQYYNDSIATAPERTAAALRSFEEPVVLLLGGRDKQLPLEDMLSVAKTACRAVVTFGESGAVMAGGAESAGLRVIRADTLWQAVEAAAGVARPGDVVLLSPACTSFDAYENFEQRGEEFKRLVGELKQEAGE